MLRKIVCAVTVFLAIAATRPAPAIDIVLDYTLDANNENWFGGTPEGLARRAAVDSAAGFLSAIITNDDWNALPTFNESFSLTDIAASSIFDVSGNTVFGTPESDGAGFDYTISTTNRSSVGENEYIIYVGALAFDAGATSHAKGGWNGSDRRNAAGVAEIEFNTWGGRIYFDTGNSWYAQSNPGINPADDYGVQDPDKSPPTDISTDNWDWSTSSLSWKGFDLKTIDVTASGKTDLYATAVHEMIHALGATSGNFADYVGLNASNQLTGPNVTSVFGGPVPTSGGHFATNTQSTVWNSAGIVSEAVLDPSSLDGVRKYLTDLDAALLRDLGYDVASSFSPADFNLDALVDGNDLAVWEAGYALDDTGDANGDSITSGADFLVWQHEIGSGVPSLAAVNAVPEPTEFVLLFAMAVTGIFYKNGKR